MGKNVSAANRTTSAVRVSYPTVFHPRAAKAGDRSTYSVVLMFDKKNKEHLEFLKGLREDILKITAEHWPDETKRPRIPPMGHNLSPIKDGDTAENKQGIPLKEKNPEYAGHYIVRASSGRKPRFIVDKNRQEILDEAEIYGGCRCRVGINAYTYDGDESKGATIGLNGIMKVADDEPFGNVGPSMEEMFGGTPEVNKVDDPFGDDVPF